MIIMYVDTNLYTDVNASPALLDYTRDPDSKETINYILCDNIDFLTSYTNKRIFRRSVFDDVESAILCGSSFLGFAEYECPSCKRIVYVPARCHGSLCSSCAVRTGKERAAFVSSMVIDGPHRHLVFTIPGQIVFLFQKHRELLNILFIAARNTIACLFNNRKFRRQQKKHKSSHWSPRKKKKSCYAYKDDTDRIEFGAIMALHTFGRDLQWNPHIHVLLSEDGYDRKNDCLKSFRFMSYEKLRKTWQYQILDLLSKSEYLANDRKFKRRVSEFYRTYDNGFYVYAKRNEKETDQDDITGCVNYITRYASRPAMSEKRIIKYDDDHKTIRYWYRDHRDDSYVEVFESVYLFLFKLLRHCPNPNFKMVRYYGFYSNRGKKILERIYELTGREYRKGRRKQRHRNRQERKNKLRSDKNRLRFRTHMIESFHKDPLMCTCGCQMIRVGSYNPFKGVSYSDRVYRDRCVHEVIRQQRETGRPDG